MDGDLAHNATQVSFDMLWTSIANNHASSIVFVSLSPALACGALSGGTALEGRVSERVRSCIRTTFRIMNGSIVFFPSFGIHDGREEGRERVHQQFVECGNLLKE
jgi:hypothetical protein